MILRAYKQIRWLFKSDIYWKPVKIAHRIPEISRPTCIVRREGSFRFLQIDVYDHLGRCMFIFRRNKQILQISWTYSIKTKRFFLWGGGGGGQGWGGKGLGEIFVHASTFWQVPVKLCSENALNLTNFSNSNTKHDSFKVYRYFSRYAAQPLARLTCIR